MCISVSYRGNPFLTFFNNDFGQMSGVKHHCVKQGVVEKALAIWPCVVLFVEPSISSCGSIGIGKLDVVTDIISLNEIFLSHRIHGIGISMGYYKSR